MYNRKILKCLKGEKAAEAVKIKTMQKIDLRVYKKEIRYEMRKIRKEMPPELVSRKDMAIFRKVTALEQYKKARTVILYVSKEGEVDTWRLIRHALHAGKQVAVPRCVEDSRIMHMHIISCVADLLPGSFGILEPKMETPVLMETRDSICVVPAFCNDYQGYRVGYGGGYYDRYLSSFQGAKVGVNYAECVLPRLMGGRYDVPIDILVTDRYIRKCKRARKHKEG